MVVRNKLALKSSIIGSLIFLAVFSSSLRFVSSSVLSSSGFVVSTPREESYLESFISIQHAINEAEEGSIVYVPSGIYYEQIVINKTISLMGENVSTVIIDGSNGGTVVNIIADNVTIAGFTIQNSGWGWTRNGIYVHYADNCKIENNHLFRNCHNIRLNCSKNSLVLDNRINGTGYGIRFISSVGCTATSNNVSNCIGGVHLQNATSCIVKRNHFTQNSQGIRMYSPCIQNEIFLNMVYKNTYDGMIEQMPPNSTFFNNIIFHNNFINNTYPFIYKVSGNIWDDGHPSGGNYWSRHNGTDMYNGPHQNQTGSDGILDASYPINAFEADRYPLVHPWSSLPVHNIKTGNGYNTIQEGIDAPETKQGHALWAESGVYAENVNVYKSLTIIGEDRSTTIIDAGNIGKVLSINADNVTLSGFTVRNSGSLAPTYGDDCGIFLNHTSGGNLSHCRVLDNRIGIYLFFSENNIIEKNLVSSNRKNGIILWYSGNNILIKNEMSNNSYNFGVFGDRFSDFNNIIDSSNSVDGKTVRYVVGVEHEIFEDHMNIGVLYLINCFNITVRNLNITNNGHAVFCYNMTDSTIENVTTSDNSYGIYLHNSNGNTVKNCRCFSNWVGIRLLYSYHDVVENNAVAYCEKGVSLRKAHYNTVEGNTILGNLYGIRVDSSSFNEIFHNNLVENVNQVSLLWAPQNVWDNGFEGNYWSSYNGSDGDRNGLGDTAKTINNDNHDHFPLLGLFHNFEISYEESLHNTAIISNSTLLDFNYESINNVIRVTINGTERTYGFCRIRIPHTLLEPQIEVIIDGGLTEVIYHNYSLRDDGFNRWIYFSYEHSVHEILIVPEFHQIILLPTLLITTLLGFLAKKFACNHYRHQTFD